jgi:carbon-monoxide dehydrogenase small subunit
MKTRLVVNGSDVEVDPAGHESLLEVLREELGLTGTKGACEQGECGSCSVILDGHVVCACLVLAATLDGAEVETVEGLAADGGLNPVQRAFAEAGAVQCGFCTPGFVVTATAMLREGRTFTETEVRERLSGNLCRCTGYGAIVRALSILTGGGTR